MYKNRVELLANLILLRTNVSTISLRLRFKIEINDAQFVKR